MDLEGFEPLEKQVLEKHYSWAKKQKTKKHYITGVNRSLIKILDNLHSSENRGLHAAIQYFTFHSKTVKIMFGHGHVQTSCRIHSPRDVSVTIHFQPESKSTFL